MNHREAGVHGLQAEVTSLPSPLLGVRPSRTPAEGPLPGFPASLPLGPFPPPPPRIPIGALLAWGARGP